MPACFFTKQQFSEWLSMGRTAKEPVCICDDCNRDFEMAMLKKHKCNRWHWQTVIFFQSRKAGK
jgi:hypothetical protein